MSRTLTLLLLGAVGLAAQDARQIVSESQKRNRPHTQRYEGVLEVIDAGSRITTKRWMSLRLGAYGDSKAIVRFLAPADVKGVALLVVNHRDRSAEQWLWRPLIGRETRVALQDRSTRFFGTDFSFEDLEERDLEQYEYQSRGEEAVDGEACWKIESTPKQAKTSQYTRSIIWIRKNDYVPAQLENFKKDALIRRLHYRQIETVQSIRVARLLEMHDLKRNSRTVLRLEKLTFDAPMKEEDFTLAALRREP